MAIPAIGDKPPVDLAQFNFQKNDQPGKFTITPVTEKNVLKMAGDGVQQADQSVTKPFNDAIRKITTEQPSDARTQLFNMREPISKEIDKQNKDTSGSNTATVKSLNGLLEKIDRMVEGHDRKLEANGGKPEATVENKGPGTLKFNLKTYNEDLEKEPKKMATKQLADINAVIPKINDGCATKQDLENFRPIVEGWVKTYRDLAKDPKDTPSLKKLDNDVADAAQKLDDAIGAKLDQPKVTVP